MTSQISSDLITTAASPLAELVPPWVLTTLVLLGAFRSLLAAVTTHWIRWHACTQITTSADALEVLRIEASPRHQRRTTTATPAPPALPPG